MAGRRANDDGAGFLPPVGGTGGGQKRPGQWITYTIQTNGTLLDDDWAAFFKQHGFLVGLSIDGPREVHDTYRVNKASKGSFGQVMNGLAALRRHGVEWNALTTVHAANQHQGREVYAFLRDECGARFIQFIPIVERATAATLPVANAGWGAQVHGRPLYTQQGNLVTSRTVTPGGYGRFLIDIFEDWVRADMHAERLHLDGPHQHGTHVGAHAYRRLGARLLAGLASYLQSVLPTDRRLSRKFDGRLSGHDNARICQIWSMRPTTGSNWQGGDLTVRGPKQSLVRLRDKFRRMTAAGSHCDREAPHCHAVSYDDRVTRSSAGPVVLRNGAGIEDPLTVVLAFLKAPGRFDVSDPSRPASFGEPDLRLANRGGARISTAQIAAILERRDPIERALRDIPPGTSLSGEVGSVPWLPLRRLFDAFADIQGVGLAKMTKALYPKRPALIPMLDSIVQRYLHDDDLGGQAPFAERALGLVRGYQRDLDRNWAPVHAVRHDLAWRGYRLTEVRILDLLILSAQASTDLPARIGPPAC